MHDARTLIDLFTQYQDDLAPDHSPRTAYQQSRFFAQVLRDLGNLPLAAVTPDLLRAWKARLSQKYKPSTVRKYLGRLAPVFRAAVEEYGWLEVSPLHRIRRPKEPRGVVRFLSAEERQRLLAACRCSANPALYPIVLLALSTGGRKNELRCLQWTQVDLDLAVVRLDQTKTERYLSVPLVGEVVTVLRVWEAEHLPGVPWVFPDDFGQRPRPIESAWRTARKQAEVKHFRFHDLRHSCGSYLAMSGASLLEISMILGHANIAQTIRYSHLTDNHLRGVVERMVHKFLDCTEKV